MFELAPGLPRIHTDAEFDEWMKTDPILPNKGEFIQTHIIGTRVYIWYIRFDSSKPWPWVYLRQAWYNTVKGYYCEIVEAKN
jgi:hypothetical protein